MPKKISNPKLKKVLETFRRQEAERQAFTERYGHAQPPQGVRVGGKVWMAHAGGIYSQIQEGPYNFVNAIHDHALHFFGIDYLNRKRRNHLTTEIPRFNGCMRTWIICKNSNDRERASRSKGEWV
jgi:hypothetical protein